MITQAKDGTYRVVTPYHVKHAALTQWDLPFSLVDYWFDKYYILVWDGQWLEQVVKDSEDECIIHDGVEYKRQWLSTPHHCFYSPKVSVSLRRIYGESTGYALLKVKGY